MKKEEKNSNCGKYRYALSRIWDEEKQGCLFVMLNPLPDQDKKDCPTIKKCIKFAKLWGFGSLHIVNLFAYICTTTKELRNTPNPVGKLNDFYIKCYQIKGYYTVVAWSKHGQLRDRDIEVLNYLERPHVLVTNKDGSPRHPLYVKDNTIPKLYK